MLTLVSDPSLPAAPVSLPGSKSEAARALILQYIYETSFGRRVSVSGLPDCDDTRELSAALARLKAGEGFSVPGEFNLGAGGTSFRFFTALVASLPGFEGVVDCAPQLRRRPLRPLLYALREAGAEIEGEVAPLHIRGKRLDGGGVRCVPGISSQFVSALMMASLLWTTPYCASDVGEVSRPYIEMTRRVMECFPAASTYIIEPDWSAASFFYELAFLNPNHQIVIERLLPSGESVQGDSACAGIFEPLGVSTNFRSDGSAVIGRRPGAGWEWGTGYPRVSIDMKDTPDLVPPLAVALAFNGVPFTLRSVGHLRHKESDRLGALREELGKVGIFLIENEESLEYEGSSSHPIFTSDTVTFDSHHDHRIGMAMAATAVRLGRVHLAGREAVSKSFPDFFRELRKVGVKSFIEK